MNLAFKLKQSKDINLIKYTNFTYKKDVGKFVFTQIYLHPHFNVNY